MPSIATFGSLSARGTGRFNGRSSNVENFEYLVVGGGGGGGGTQEADYGEKGGGGGGAGTYKAGKLSNFSVRSGSTYLITVGAGGNGGPSAVQGGDGGLSQFASITSPGGGGGGAGVALSGVRAGTTDGRSGGNGGGAGGGNRGQGYFGGAGPATDGNRGGGTFSDPTGGAGGGGGGDTNFGQPTDISGSNGGNGGFGVQNSITGTALYYSGGGGGGKSAYNAGSNGTGGSGVGGNGGGQDSPFQGAATNTVIWSTLNLGGVSRESNGAYCGFLNSYGVSDGGGLSRDVTINFPQTGTYSFEFSVDNYGSVSLDGTKIYDVEGENNYQSSSAVTRTVTAGNHTLSIRGYNLGDDNPFSMGVAITGMIPAVKITSGSGGGGASSDKITGGKGCQGCVVLKYPSSYAAPVSAQGATITVSNGYRIIAYTTVGAYTLTF
jgi:hypothetical protein